MSVQIVGERERLRLVTVPTVLESAGYMRIGILNPSQKPSPANSIFFKILTPPRGLIEGKADP